MAQNIIIERSVTIRFACVCMGVSESCYRYQTKLSSENALIADWLLRLTQTYKRWGFGLCYLYLRNVKGFGWNHKRVHYTVEVKKEIEEQYDEDKPKTFAELWGRFTVTDEDVKDIEDAKFITPNLIIQGHVVALVAQPNAGKTALAMHVAEGLVDQGLQVVYLNFDASSTDIRNHHELAKRAGYRLISPDIKVGLSVADAVDNLILMAEMEETSNAVVFIDTLKKCTEVINKNTAKEFYKILRKLSAQGMTVVLLCHANKYRDKEGELVYEGTGDLRADVDDLIYLEYHKSEFVQTISTYLGGTGKVRGVFEPISFSLDLETRNVSLLNEYVDVRRNMDTLVERHKIDSDGQLTEAIIDFIKDSPRKQGEILDYCKNLGRFGKKRVLKILEMMTTPATELHSLTMKQEKTQKNAKIYTFLKMPFVDDFFG
jgi:hypothetical protein